MSLQNILCWVISVANLEHGPTGSGEGEICQVVAARWKSEGGEPPPVSLCWHQAQIDQDWVGAEISWVPKVFRKAEERQPSVTFAVHISWAWRGQLPAALLPNPSMPGAAWRQPGCPEQVWLTATPLCWVICGGWVVFVTLWVRIWLF